MFYRPGRRLFNFTYSYHNVLKSDYSIKADKTLIAISEADGIRNIILDDPKTRNALSLSMMTQLMKALCRNINDQNLRCIVISSSSTVFSGGHNLKELTMETGPEFHKKVFDISSEFMMSILKLPVPVIAKVNGPAAAAGCQLVAGCDMAICSDISTFSTPGANVGIFCSTPGIPIARKMPLMKASYMLFTGLPIKADEALHGGLVSRVVPVEELDAETDKICNAIKSKSRSVIELGKKFYYRQLELSIQVAYKYGEQVMVDNLTYEDGQEGISSFIEKRKPIWTHTDDKIEH